MHNNINPSNIFYCNYQNDIEVVRNSLFNEIDNISSDFADEAKSILYNKIRLNQKPLLGELFPWIISDIIHADKSLTQKVSIAWFAIYLYTLFIDDYIDSPEMISTNKFLTASILAKNGLLKLSKFTNGTKYEEIVYNALDYSAFNQKLDSELNSSNLNNKIKIKYSSGKNHILISCAGALASLNSKYSVFIEEFTDSLLLSLQYLDDIADYGDDFQNKNFTVLLNDAISINPNILNGINKYSNSQLLEQLLFTGSLQRVISKIESLLLNSFTLIQDHNLYDLSKSSIILFKTLLTHVTDLKISIDNIDITTFKNIPLSDKQIILDKIEANLKIIAQST